MDEEFANPFDTEDTGFIVFSKKFGKGAKKRF